MPAIRVLVVDDYKEWQRSLQSRLESEPDLEIIGVANNGLEGAEKAAELQPDLVLMDLHMPLMNGLAATRRIREVSPNSKVLFVTENSSLALVSAAFEAGACGYVLKSDSADDLVPGIKALSQNKKFVSHGLWGEIIHSSFYLDPPIQ